MVTAPPDSAVPATFDVYWAEGTTALVNTREACTPAPVFSTDCTPAFLTAENR